MSQLESSILAPCRGVVIPLSQTPDELFAQQMLGPGVAIEPTNQQSTAVAPMSGRIVKIHPHAFVIQAEDDQTDSSQAAGILVHLGINTVQLQGEGFTVLASDGDVVTAGDPIITWDPAQVAEAGMSPIVPIVALEHSGGITTSGSVEKQQQPGTVEPGDFLFSLDTSQPV